MVKLSDRATRLLSFAVSSMLAGRFLPRDFVLLKQMLEYNHGLNMDEIHETLEQVRLRYAEMAAKRRGQL